MTDKQHIVIILVSLFISAGIWITAAVTEKEKTDITSTVFQVGHGWGYDILVNDSLFIRQESVPVISYGKGFPRRQQAEAAAALVISKLSGKKMPTLTRPEIEKILESDTLNNDREREDP